MCNHTKIVFLDLEGTLIKPVTSKGLGDIGGSMWSLIPQTLGPNAMQAENLTKELWVQGAYSSAREWAEASLMVHQKYNLSKQHFEKLVDENTVFHAGTAKTIHVLRSQGIKTCIISGGFVYQAEKVRRILGIDHAIAACDYQWNTDGSLASWRLVDCDYEHKVTAAKTILNEYGVAADECGAIGDGSNDVALHRFVGVSIAFNASPKLQTVAHHIITQERDKEDFSAVLPHLLSYRQNSG